MGSPTRLRNRIVGHGEEWVDQIGVDDADLRAVLMDFEAELKGESDEGETEADEGREGPEAMALQPYEHYDYVIVLARNLMDWEALCERLGLRRADGSEIRGKRKVGLARAADAEKLLALLGGAGE